MQSTETRIAWITGGGSGIGRALSLRLARDGWQVAVSGRRQAALLETVTLAGADVHAYPLDVSDLGAVRETAARIEKQLGPVDLAVLNAGFGQFVNLNNLRAETFAAHMQVNYLGVVNPIDALLASFRRRRSGHIVIVASVAGYRGMPRILAYGPTKAALINLAESLYLDLKREGIRLSICNPGFVKTPMTADNHGPMPFLMDLDKAADALYRGIRKNKFEITFPWQLVSLLKVFRCLPYWIYFPIMRKFTGR